jgi:hypothetical protein
VNLNQTLIEYIRSISIKSTIVGVFFTYGACQEQGNQILVKFEKNMHLKELL